MTYSQITISDALLSLVPTAEFVVVGNTYDGINWSETNQVSLPSKEEIELEMENLRLRYESLKYQRQRSLEYPPIGDQLDSLFHAGVFPPEMASQIQAIKDKYPKPE